MWQGMRKHALVGIVALAGLAAFTPGASASVSASMSVTSATPVTAGSNGNLGLDLKFTPSSSGGAYNDGPDNVTLNLPPGVLANASIDNGQCLKVADITDSTCQIGSGVVTADAGGVVPIPTPVNFFLVPPPAAGDLAGLAVATGQGDQVGSTDAIVIRPSGSTNGVGVTLELTLPNSINGASVDVTEINSTFTGIRFPATCPSTPADITLSANSYNAPSTDATAMAPLPVSGCGALSYNPQYSLSAVRDANDKVVKLTTTITQAATESPNATVSLAFPQSSLSASLGGLKNLCSSVTSGTCSTVGSVTAASPDYPTPLTGQAYLTGSLAGLSLTLVFPPPFPLTLVGSVDLKTNTTTFSGLPDIPLTSLVVSLNGGPEGLFDTNCAVPTNTSTATTTDQNGDKTASLTSKFTIQGCPSTSGSSSSGSGSSGSSSSSSAVAQVTSTRVRGLTTGRPSLRFTLRATKRSNVKSFSVKLPKGLSLRTRRVHKRRQARGLSLAGAKLRSESVHKGVLEVTLKKPVRRVTVTIASSGLKESKALRAQARAKSRKKRLHSLRLTVLARSSKGKHATIRVTIKNLGL